MEGRDIENAMKGIGIRVRECRKNARYTQKQLANMIGRTESSIAKYERGVVEIPMTVLHNIANALDVNVNYLALGNNEPMPTSSLAGALKSPEGVYLLSRVVQEQFSKMPKKERNETMDGLLFLAENQDTFLIITESLNKAISEFPYFKDKTYVVGIMAMFGEYLSTINKYRITDEDALMLVRLFTRTKEIMDKTEE